MAAVDKRREYEVFIAGVRHTLLLTETDAEKCGAKLVQAAKAVENKARLPENK